MELLNIKYQKYKLDNGLEVILHQNKNLQAVAVNVWYKVGSAQETKWKTGIAHLFEHMMFQGSENVEKELHFKYVQESGGTLNGSTSIDRTNYYEKLPSNYLELALWLESDRMGYFLPALNQEKLDNQKDVVFNERLERYDNQPYGLAWELLITNLYDNNHPYSWPTIGFADDIKNYNLNDVVNFFKKYYSPNNASLVVAGNFDVEKTKSLIEKYFANIESGEKLNHLKMVDKKLDEKKIITHEDNVHLERLYLSWPTGKAYDEDDAALDILSDLLTGSKNSRLHKNLVFQKEIAQDISAFQFSGIYAGHFTIIATVKPGHTLDEIKSEIFNEINNIKANGISSKELNRSKIGIKSSFVFSLQNLESIADHLNSYNFYLNEPNSFSYDLNRYDKVTPEEINNVSENYLSKPFVELRIIPKKSKT
ncbi:MAG: insulinase family protein [Bacteroidetes bacterium]|nr:insulinase family protein [Bacteroidota bacterium]